ncbi:MAG: leucine-rich repeat protein [Oscillospiraceae bacterium]|nr:leucine-rich repeat protein [Oscillospiraceae bacterium]
MRKLRKIAAFLTASVLCMGLLPPLSASADTWTPLTDTIEWQLDESGTLTVRGTGEMPDFTCSGYQIKQSERAFLPMDTEDLAPWYTESWEQICHIVVEEGITRISEMAFIGCTNAVSASIPASVTTISNKAFSCCYSMQEVDFAADSQLDYLGMETFAYNHDLTQITLPESLTEMSGTAFDHSSLTSLHIPENVNTIHPQLFSFMKKNTEFTVDPDNSQYTAVDGVLYNKRQTILFRYPAAREQDTFFTPDTVQSVEGAAFAYTTNLGMVYFTDNVLSFASNLFMYSKSATAVRFPEALYSLPNQCFVGCMSLRTLLLPVLLGNAQKGFLETEQLDVYYPGTQEALAEIPGHSAFTQTGYTLHCNTTEDDLISADLSGDGTVNAQDAAHLLSYAAKCGADFNGGLMLYQHKFTDGLVLAPAQSGDGAVPATLVTGTKADASDAAVILQYAAAVGSGYGDGLAAFLDQ